VSKKTWIIFVVIVIGLLVTLVLVSRNSNPAIDTSKIDPNKVQPASAANGDIADHVLGKADSKVLLIEYGDFQCPGCGSAHPRIKAIAEAYQNQIGFVFRNFPLTTIHPNARAAAGSAEAAGLMGKYWEMHNALYENQKAWSNLTGDDRANAFAEYAGNIGLNRSEFTTNLSDNRINQKISFDQAIGKSINVDSTPTFYLNGVKLDTATWGSESKLVEAINTELQKAGITPPAYTPSGK